MLNKVKIIISPYWFLELGLNKALFAEVMVQVLDQARYEAAVKCTAIEILEDFKDNNIAEKVGWGHQVSIKAYAVLGWSSAGVVHRVWASVATAIIAGASTYG